jgi:flagellar biogenesis protein FliO
LTRTKQAEVVPSPAAGRREADIEGLLVGLIWLLIYALIIAVILYVIVRLVAQFVPGAAPYTWILWCIGGLILILLAIRLLGSAIPSPP